MAWLDVFSSRPLVRLQPSNWLRLWSHLEVQLWMVLSAPKLAYVVVCRPLSLITLLGSLMTYKLTSFGVSNPTGERACGTEASLFVTAF